MPLSTNSVQRNNRLPIGFRKAKAVPNFLFIAKPVKKSLADPIPFTFFLCHALSSPPFTPFSAGHIPEMFHFIFRKAEACDFALFPQIFVQYTDIRAFDSVQTCLPRNRKFQADVRNTCFPPRLPPEYLFPRQVVPFSLMPPLVNG